MMSLTPRGTPWRSERRGRESHSRAAFECTLAIEARPGPDLGFPLLHALEQGSDPRLCRQPPLGDLRCPTPGGHLDQRRCHGSRLAAGIGIVPAQEDERDLRDVGLSAVRSAPRAVCLEPPVELRLLAPASLPWQTRVGSDRSRGCRRSGAARRGSADRAWPGHRRESNIEQRPRSRPRINSRSSRRASPFPCIAGSRIPWRRGP